MSAGIFNDENNKPDETELQNKLGDSYPVLEKVIEFLQSNYEGISLEWKYSKRFGWFLIYNLKKKRLFYIIPQKDNFTFL